MSYTSYQKYDWQTGEIVTEPKLDHMEDGLEAASAQVAENIEDITELKAEMPHKANTNGYYTEMSVGNSEQLISTVTLEDQTPYTFRTSGGSLEIGNRESVKKIVGGTVAWNQLEPVISDSTFGSQNCTVTWGNNEVTVTATGTTNAGIYLTTTRRFSVIGHKYFTAVTINTAQAGDFRIGLNAAATIITIDSTGQDITVATIQNATSAKNGTVVYKASGSVAEGDTYTARNMWTVDLTQLFGVTIADYIYNLEQSTAGAGVSLFRKLFPKTYYQPHHNRTLVLRSPDTMQNK